MTAVILWHVLNHVLHPPHFPRLPTPFFTNSHHKTNLRHLHGAAYMRDRPPWNRGGVSRGSADRNASHGCLAAVLPPGLQRSGGVGGCEDTRRVAPGMTRRVWA